MNQTTAIGRLKALADPTRIRILGLLGEEELMVSELTSILGMTQSRVSGHLAVLRDADLVQDRRQGTSAFYSLSASGPSVETWRTLSDIDPEFGASALDLSRLAGVIRRRNERSREFFDRAAGGWDQGRSESLGHFAGGYALAGLLPRTMTVLDLGTGTGGLLPTLGRHVDQVVAVDMSRGMLEQAQQRLDSTGPGNVDLLRADAGNLPFPSGSVDGVVANMILHHLPDPGAALREVARVLRPGGRGVIVDFESHDEQWLIEEEAHIWAGFDPAQIGGWCLDAGLTVPEFQQIPTPDAGRWSRLNVFVARFGRVGSIGVPE